MWKDTFEDFKTNKLSTKVARPIRFTIRSQQKEKSHNKPRKIRTHDCNISIVERWSQLQELREEQISAEK